MYMVRVLEDTDSEDYRFVTSSCPDWFEGDKTLKRKILDELFYWEPGVMLKIPVALVWKFHDNPAYLEEDLRHSIEEMNKDREPTKQRSLSFWKDDRWDDPHDAPGDHNEYIYLMWQEN